MKVKSESKSEKNRVEFSESESDQWKRGEQWKWKVKVKVKSEKNRVEFSESYQ